MVSSADVMPVSSYKTWTFWLSGVKPVPRVILKSSGDHVPPVLIRQLILYSLPCSIRIGIVISQSSPSPYIQENDISPSREVHVLPSPLASTVKNCRRCAWSAKSGYQGGVIAGPAITAFVRDGSPSPLWLTGTTSYDHWLASPKSLSEYEVAVMPSVILPSGKRVIRYESFDASRWPP